MKRPSSLIYSVDEKPPALVSIANAIQHLTVIAPIFIFTILVLRTAGATEAAVADAVSITFIVSGITVVLVAWPGRWIGSGYLLAVAPSAVYIPVSISAIAAGGMPLLAGMTMIAGLFEIAASQVVRRFRAFFPAEISGLCVLLIGIYVGVLAIRSSFGLDPVTGAATATATDFGITALTLTLMIGLNLWGRGTLRMLCAVIGMACGYGVAVILGAMHPESTRVLANAPLFAVPNFRLQMPTFQFDLVIPVLAVALTSALREMGDITTAQKINDRDWIRPDMASISKGIFANGVGTVLAGLAGVIGGSTQSASVGMSNATGVTSRWVAYWLAGIMVLCSLFPVVAAVLVAAPRPVIGASFMFLSCFIIVSGLQIITSRLLDARRTFIVGLSLILSLGHEIFPALYGNAPLILQPFTSSSLAVGLAAALVLNALFRIGIRSRATLVVARGQNAHDPVRAFLEEQGARWGARRDVVERAIFGTAQAVESIGAHGGQEGPVTIEASFDEFNLDVRLTYQGEAFIVPDHRPSPEEIEETEEGLRLLAGYLVARTADRVRTGQRAGRCQIELHYQH